MQRFIVVAAVLVAAFAAMTWLSLAVVPPWAQQILQEGRELPLEHQVVIAAAHLWTRSWILLAAGLLVALVAWGRRAASVPASDGD